MNIVIKDTETGIILFGQATLENIANRGVAERAKVLRIPAEAYIVFLQAHYTNLPEVREYLRATESQGINPQEGKLLKAIDDVLDLSHEEVDRLFRIVKEAGEEE